MAINIKLGQYDGDDEIVDKDGLIDWDEDYTSCTMVNTDLLNPVLKLMDTHATNYVEIPFFGGRYYFVETVEALAGGHCLLHCHVDVLYSYKTDILGLTCIVSRNESKDNWKKEICDKSIIASNRRVIFGEEFGTKMVTENEEYILGTI